MCLDMFKNMMAKTWRRLMLAVRFFTAKKVVSEASALTYSTLLAIVPILAVVFAVARGFGYNKYIELWFRDAFSSQPAVAETLIGFVNSYLIHTHSSIFLGVGLVVMLYTVLMLVMNIERVFNAIWQVKRQRSLFRTFTDYMAMLFMCPIAIVLMSGVSFFLANIAGLMPYVSVLTPTVKLLINISPFIIMSLIFIGLYIFVSGQLYVTRYNAIYGSFAALPLFMLWIQISWTICLFGAELCYTSQNVDYYDLNATTNDISHRYRLMLCALLLSSLCKRHDEGGQPYSANELRDKTSIPIRIVNDLLFKMQEAKLICELSCDEKGEQTRFLPAISGDKMSVGLMIDRLESVGQWKLSLPDDLLKSPSCQKAVKLRSSYLQASRDILLRDL